MTVSPQVSVIVPNYNHQAYLEQRLESIFAQSFDDFELIFLDDASTDQSLAVFEKFRDRAHIHFHANKQNTGNPFVQWNRGVKLARGQWIWIAESDDYADPEFLAQLIAALQAHPSAGVAYCSSERVDSQGRILAKSARWAPDLHGHRWQQDFFAKGSEECQQYLALRNTLPNASAVLFRRDVFQAIGHAPEDYRYAGDWVTWIRMLLASDLCFVAKRLNFFREHPQSVRSSAYRDGTWSLEHYRILDLLKNAVGLDRNMETLPLRAAMSKWIASATEPHSPMLAEDHQQLWEYARKVDSQPLRHALRIVAPQRWGRYAKFLWQLRSLQKNCSRR